MLSGGDRGTLSPCRNVADNNDVSDVGRRRKTWAAALTNVLSPARIQDVDWEKAKDIAARDVLTDMLRGQPGVRVFERPYVAPEAVPQMTPEEFDAYVRAELARWRKVVKEARASVD